MSGAAGQKGVAWPPILFVLFLLVAILLGIHPADRSDWLLENVLVALALIWLVHGYRRSRLSNTAYALLFMFGVLHEIGAHFQYAGVPYDEAFRSLTGCSIDAMFGFERNHYDRLVHFLYGLMLTPVAAEIIDLRVRPDGIWRFLLPVTFMFAQAPIYELIEWAAASAFGGELGAAYLGTQGDAWDAHKDMALAGLGSLIAQPLWMWARPRQSRDVLPT